MFTDLIDLIDLYDFPTGRRIFAQRKVLEIAKARGETDLVPRLEKNIAGDTKARELEIAWAIARGKPQHAEGAPALDALVDRGLSGFQDALGATINTFGPDSPNGAAATRIRNAVFPMGVQAVSGQTYVEEHETVTTIVKQLRGDLAEDVSRLGLGGFVDRLDELNTRYGKLLGGREPASPSSDQVRKARAEGQRNLLRVVACVLGRHPDDTAKDIAARQELLGPIMAQNEAIRAHRRNRRNPSDVDPATGEDVLDPAAGPASST